MNLFTLPTYRTTDPDTAREAGKRAAKDREAAEVVALILADGIARTDEEIAEHKTAKERGKSPDRLRHGRKALQLAGLIVEAGIGKSVRGARMTKWRKA